MWIAKWKYDRLVERLDSQRERIESLERAVMVDQYEEEISPLGFGLRMARHPVNRVVEAVLNHLGMDYRHTKKEESGLVKREKPKK